MAKSKSNKIEQLSVEQENSIDLLVLGKSDLEVSQQVGVSRPTICLWRNQNVEFAAELRRRRAAVWGGVVDQQRVLVQQAQQIVAAALVKEDLAAALAVLKAAKIQPAMFVPDPQPGQDSVLRWLDGPPMEQVDRLGL